MPEISEEEDVAEEADEEMPPVSDDDDDNDDTISFIELLVLLRSGKAGEYQDNHIPAGVCRPATDS